MLFQTFLGIIKTLAEQPEPTSAVPFCLVYNTGLEAWALLDLTRDIDKLSYFEDSRNAALCLLTPDDLSRLPQGFDPAKCEVALVRYMAADAHPALQMPFLNCFTTADVVTPAQPITEQ